MDYKVPISYLKNLLNISLDEKTELYLTSAQRARVYAWLKTNNYRFNRDLLSEVFTLERLLMMNEEAIHTQEDMSMNLQNTQSFRYASTDIVGIDIQSISEFFPNGPPPDLKYDKELMAIFTLRELSYAQSRVDPCQTLAGIFAAKEAILKTMDLGSNLLDIEVIINKHGRPTYFGYSISISHSADFAIAIAMKKLDY